MCFKLFILLGLLFLACPAVAHGVKGYEEKSINKAKATKLIKLRRMTACFRMLPTLMK